MSTASRRPSDARPVFVACEPLEGRTLFSGSGKAVLDHGTLVVKGTSRADVISVSLAPADPTAVQVFINDAATPAYAFRLTEVAAIRIDGGRGNDDLRVVESHGVITAPATIVGGKGHDYIEGGSGDDHLFGQDGEDTILGDVGMDEIDGGKGDDHLLGNGGADRIVGGDGNDLIEGGGNNDTLLGGKGNDEIRGDDGEDLIVGGRGNDDLFGDAGNDRLEGEGGFDQLDGGLGDDTLVGGRGLDEVTGSAGIDTFDRQDRETEILDLVVGTDVHRGHN
ncbi:MAG TPA: calcium-binding protein [Humisphaera sp.]